MALLSHLNCKFHLVRDKHTSSSYGALQGSVTDDTLSYEETLHWIGRSKCLVEILQEGQSGSSLRTLEALFYGKKLLTNNRTIVSEPYYDQQRVFILDRDNPADLRAFIDRPLDLEENARYWCRSIYHIDQWLEHFRRME